jgi:hypothetical protein
MQRLVIGSLMAAVVMFALVFVFFGVLGTQAYSPATTEAAMAIQTAMEDNLAGTGTYMVPAEEEAWMTGPSAIVNYVAAGDAPVNMTVTMAEGFAHMLVSALLLGAALMAVGGDFRHRSRVALWVGLAAAVFMHLGDPLWFGFDWRNALFVFVADGVMFIAGGVVLAWWLASAPAASTAAAPAE